MEDNISLPHRDDVPFEEVKEFERMMAEQFPGMKVVFAGDLPDSSVPESVREFARALEERHRQSLVNCACLDCGTPMPGVDPADGPEKMPEGWRWFSNHRDEPTAFLCPECDALDQEGGIRPYPL